MMMMPFNCSKIQGRDLKLGWQLMEIGPEKNDLAQWRRRRRRRLFVFNNTIEGPRAPAVKPGRINQD
jgi:hypothetical protein